MMLVHVALTLKADREGRPIGEVIREHETLGHPAIDSGHEFWKGHDPDADDCLTFDQRHRYSAAVKSLEVSDGTAAEPELP